MTNFKNRNSRQFIILFLFAAAVVFLSQCKPLQKGATTSFQEETGLLWEIADHRTGEKSYLFGTIHMIPAEDFFLPEGTLNAVENSELFFFEVDMSSLEDPMNQMKILQQSYMIGDTTLSELLSKDDFSLVKKHFENIGIPIILLERIKPLFLTVFADENINPQAVSDGSLKFYEMEFLEMANAQQKEVRGLEEISYQLAMMDSIPYKMQAEMLVEGIKMGDTGSSELDALVKLYTEQKIGELYQSFTTDTLAQFDKLLLVNRNQNWIPVMEDAMNENTCFFAVGAAHLGGEYGVINLLRQKGYLLRPIYMKAKK